MPINSKVQNFIKKLSESTNVKRVLNDIQTISDDLQKRVHNINTDEAVKKYKDIIKKVSSSEQDLHKEMNKVVTKLKKSAGDLEKNLNTYKSRFEKVIKDQKMNMTSATKSASAKSTSKAKTVKKTTNKKARKAVKKAK